MAYGFDQIFAADPANPANIAQNASITIFAPGDGTMTPLTITDPDGQPLANPITVNANGFGSAFAHETLDRVAWAGGSFTGFFTSYEGLKNEAVAARTAAEAAATDASIAAVADLADRIASGQFVGPAGQDGTNGTNGVNGSNVLPTQEAIEQAIINPGPAKTALDATYVKKVTNTTIDLVRDYGADPTGATDSSTKMQQAINDLGLGGGEIILSGRGATFLWLNATPSIKPWMTGRLTIRIAAGVTVKLTSNNRRFLDPGKVADHDIFRKLTITGGGTIDVDNVTGNNHTIFGTLRGGDYMTRVGFEDIVIENLTVINAPVDPTMTAHRLHVWLMPKHPASNEATQDKITNILVRDLKMVGGNAGVGVGAITDDGLYSANVFLDDIVIERCHHDMLAPATATFYSSNYHVGQSAFGNRVTIRDCVGLYAADDGIEINGMDSAVVENCRMVDSVLMGVLVRNFRPSANPSLQKTTLRNVVVEHRSLGTTSATPGRGFVYSGTNDLGAVEMENCTYYRKGDAYSDTNNYDEALSLTAPVKSLTSRGLRVVVEGYSTTSMSQTLGNALCAFNPSNSPTCHISLKDSDVRVAGIRAAESTNYKIWRPFSFSPSGTSELTLTIDGMVFDYAQTNSAGAGTAQVLCFLGGVVRANVRRLAILATTDLGITLATVAAGVSPASRYRFDGCDSSKVTGTEFVVPAAQAPQVIIINHRWKTSPRAAAGVTPGASPYNYQNLDMTPEWVTVQGGTVSTIEYSVDGTTYWSLGATQGVFQVQPAEHLRITYSVAPSVTKVFAR